MDPKEESASKEASVERDGSLSEDNDDAISIGGKIKEKRKHPAQWDSHCLPNADITVQEFRKMGKRLIDFIADYMESPRDRPVEHQALPGFLFKNMPKLPPRDGVSDISDIFKEINDVIVPGLPQWQSPKHHAMLPVGGSYASLLGSILCDGLGCIGFSWGDCPSATELEMLVTNWLGELMDLPREFLFFGKTRQAHGNGGGGMILGNTSEVLLTVTCAAKRMMMDTMRHQDRDLTNWELKNRLVLYCSEQAHPCLERVAEVAGVRLKRLWTDKDGIMHCESVRHAIEKDKQKGYIPFMVVGTVGTIASTSVDQISKIGPLLLKEEPHIWFHVESGYAGSSFICREYQPLVQGIETADSFSMSAHKWLPIHMDCACLWVKTIGKLTTTFSCEDPEGPLYIPADDKNEMADYRHWTLSMTRRFRAMKLWMVFKLYGVRGLQQKIREDVRRAKEMEKLIREDHRFEIIGDVVFGVIAFRCKKPDNNELNRKILNQINQSAVIKMTGARVNHKYWLRFVVAGRYTNSEDITFSWETIKRTTNKVIAENPHLQGKPGKPVHVVVREERRSRNEPSDPPPDDKQPRGVSFS